MHTSPFPLDHVGIAVRSIQESMPLFERIANSTGSAVEEVASQGTRVAFVGTGSARLELLEAAQPDSPIARFLEKRGPGLHHVAYRVPDIIAALKEYESEGVDPIDREPRPGAAGHRVAFLHPKSTAGVLIELVEYPHSNAGG